jgi:hypothetical protein
MKENQKAYIVAVDMGYGHQRAAYPLLFHAATPLEWKASSSQIISADDYPGISFFDKLVWTTVRKIYEMFSRTSTIPLIGRYIFDILDYVQRIEPFYPRRDLSKPMFQSRRLYATIRKGHGKHLIEALNKNSLPFFTTFFAPAFFADEHGYKGEIYCLCTDSDISRAWAPLDPKKSRIIYCAPSIRVKERLLLYGVRSEKIVFTGFPLPKEILGSKKGLEIAKASLARRIGKLDPNGTYQKKYAALIAKQLGKKFPIVADNDPLTITFAVGGAGAQIKIGIAILSSLHKEIKAGKIKLNLVAGSSKNVQRKYWDALHAMGIHKENGVKIIYDPTKYEYLKEFNDVLRKTDILWTKPSELSFYAGAGLPIIIAPPLGAHEKYNRRWLLMNGAGFDQNNPVQVNEWLADWLKGGILAEAAMNGFINTPKLGTFNIEELIFSGRKPDPSA